MIRILRFKFGRSAGQPAQELALTPLTVFVGPNNSGKTRVLSEIAAFCENGVAHVNNVIVDRLAFLPTPPEKVDAAIARFEGRPATGELVAAESIVMAGKNGRLVVDRSRLRDAIANPDRHIMVFCSWFLRFGVLMLSGPTRVSHITDQPAGDLQAPPSNPLQKLFGNDELRGKVRQIVLDAFRKHFVIDPTNLGMLRIRLSDSAPASPEEERGIDKRAVDFHGRATPITQFSDGVKAFTGIVLEVVAGDPAILLIDEPEAFLHPSLSFALGQEIAKTTADSEKRIFVSTHSSQFLMGCIQTGLPVNIVRLTFRNNVATARVLPHDQLVTLMRNPLLRSVDALSGVFYEAVVVTVSDTDRAFYQEINDRLLRFRPEWGIPNCLFLNAQNKQTVHSIIRPLRQLGIPSAAIVDIDVVKEGGQNWGNFLDAGYLPDVERNPLSVSRANIKRALEATGRDMKRDGGIELLAPGDKEGAENLFDRLEQYGLFVVRKGELESWLKALNVPGKGPEWLIAMFEKMGENPVDQTYVKPAADDVWAFIRNIKTWFVNERRKGIPS